MRVSRLFSVVLILALVPAVRAQTSAPSKTRALPVWSASERQLAMLAAPADLHGFSLRPPAGFAASPDFARMLIARMPTNSRGVVAAWRGASDSQGVPPVIASMTAAVPKTSAATPSDPAGFLLTSFLRSFEAGRTGVVQSKIEHGRLGGLPAARVAYQNVLTRREDRVAIPMRGFAYAAYDSKSRNLIVIYAEDSQQGYANSSGASLEASVLTLKPN